MLVLQPQRHSFTRTHSQQVFDQCSAATLHCYHSPSKPVLDTSVLIPDRVIYNVLPCLQWSVLVWGWSWGWLGWLGVGEVWGCGLTRNRRVWCDDGGSSPGPGRDLWGTAKTDRDVFCQFFFV